MLFGNVIRLMGTEGRGTKRQGSCAVGEREAKRGEVNGEITYKSYVVSSNTEFIFYIYFLKSLFI